MAPSEVLLRPHQEFKRDMRHGIFLSSIWAFRRELAQAETPPWEAEALWHIAEGYHRMAHFQEASAYWTRALKVLPQGSLARAARAALAESLFRSGELEQALELYMGLSQEFEVKREILWASFRTGDCLVGIGEDKDARLWYRRAMELNPPPAAIPPESLENLAKMALDMGDAREAGLMSMTALGLYPEHPRASSWTLILARSMRLQSKPFQAAWLLDRLLDKDEKCREAGLARLMLMTLGFPCTRQPVSSRLSARRGDLETLKLALFNEKPTKKDLQMALGELAECWAESGRAAQAWELLESFHKGLGQDSIWPEFQRATWKTGRALIAQTSGSGEPERAVEVFHWLAERIPGVWNEPGLLLKAAKAHENLGFLSTAADLYGRARTLVHAGAQAREAAMGLVRSHLAAGRLDEASRALRQEPSLEPLKATGMSLLDWAAKVASTRGFQVAADFLTQISYGRPGPEVFISFGLMSIEKDLCAPAARLVDRGLEPTGDEQSPSLVEAWVVMGDVFRCAGDPAEASRWYERVARRPNWGETEKWAALRLAQVSMGTPSEPSALKYLERLGTEPNGSPWRVLAEELRQGRALRENVSKRGSS
jgi:tetratricopeptide (TPR) repeat protein